MIKEISFRNYKTFKDEQTIEFKPITILIGKNSAGKSAITKLPVLIDNCVNHTIGEPFSIEYNDVQFGGEYRDVFYGRIPYAELQFRLSDESGRTLEVTIVSDYENNTVPQILSWKLSDVFNLAYVPPNNHQKETNLYRDIYSDNLFICEFDGFNLASMVNIKGEPELFLPNLYQFSLTTDYIGPLRVNADTMRSFPIRTRRKYETIGLTGEQAYAILALETLTPNSDLIDSVSRWYQDEFDGWGIKVNKDHQPHYSVELTRGEKFEINIADVGQGMSQALPLVVSAFLANPRALTIMEQPELHIHPAAHGSLAELFANSLKDSDRKYLIETHSQNFILRLRRMVAEKRFPSESINIYWVDYDKETNSSSLVKITVDEDGGVDFWPEGVFSETLDETIAIRKAQLNNRK